MTGSADALDETAAVHAVVVSFSVVTVSVDVAILDLLRTARNAERTVRSFSVVKAFVPLPMSLARMPSAI